MTARKIGVVINSLDGSFHQDVIDGIQLAAQQRGYKVVLEGVDDGTGRKNPVSLDLDELAGLLIVANAASDDFIRKVYYSGKPLSLISNQVRDLPIPAVLPDNIHGIAILVKYLVETCKRRKLVFVRGLMDQNDAIQREAACRLELMRYNLNIPDEFWLKGDFIPLVAETSISQLLKSTRDFDGIIVADYLMGVVVMDALERGGIQIPDDVSVVAFGDGHIAAEAGLTTVAADVLDLGSRATRQLIGQIEGMKIRGVTMLSAELMERRSGRISLMEQSAIEING